MDAGACLRYLQREIHTAVAATIDTDGLPVTCAVDIMDADEGGLYFLTARGKGFYGRLKATALSVADRHKRRKYDVPHGHIRAR